MWSATYWSTFWGTTYWPKSGEPDIPTGRVIPITGRQDTQSITGRRDVASITGRQDTHAITGEQATPLVPGRQDNTIPIRGSKEWRLN